MFDQQRLNQINEEIEQNKKLVKNGPWLTEPDRVEFKYAGFDCLLQRAPMLHWCGYVGVPIECKSRVNEDELQVHGGITYKEECRGHVCHITESGDNLFWFGYDCAHSGDIIPIMDRDYSKSSSLYQRSFPNDIYRNIDFVMRETKHLAEQLKEQIYGRKANNLRV